MIDDFIQCELEKILQALCEFETAKKEYEELKKREIELNEIMEKTGVFTGQPITVEYPAPIKEQKFNVFQRMFSKKYKEYIRLQEEYRARCDAAQEKRDRLLKEREQARERAKVELDQVKSDIAKCEEVMSSRD